MAYIPNLPYHQLSPINEEGKRLTELVTDYSDESYTDSWIYVVDVGSGHKDNELPEHVSADDLTANASNEDDTQRDARRAKNCEREQWREDVRQRQQQRTQRSLQTEFERAAEQGFHTPVDNIMHTARLLDHIKDPAVVQSINSLQHAALQLNEKDRMPSLSRSQGHAGSSRTAGARPRRQEGNAQNNQDQQIVQGNQNQSTVEPAHSATGGRRGN